MNPALKSHSIVIVANSHNPSIISESFLIKSEIIENESELNKDAFIFSNILCQFTLVNGTQITVQPNVLKVENKDSKILGIIIDKYCKNLPNIKTVAIGINFEYDIDEEIIEKQFGLKPNKDFDTHLSGIDLYFPNPENEAICNIKLVQRSVQNVSSAINFNFHFDKNESTLGDLNFEFMVKVQKCEKIAIDYIKSLLS